MTRTSRPSITNLFYRNARLTGLTVGFILIAGFAALSALARQEDPTMTERYGSIDTFLPGATAERVEALVTERLETALREIPEIRTLDSISRAGYSMVGVELDTSVDQAEAEIVWSEIRDKLGEVQPQLPPATRAPDLQVRGPIAVTMAVALRWQGAGEPQMRLLTRLAQDLELTLANLPGTRETELHGAAEEQIRVELAPRPLAALGLNASDVARFIRASDTRSSAGRLHDASTDLLVEVGGEVDSVERIAAIPLRQHDDGRLVRVADIADVRREIADPARTVALVGGERAVVVSVTMEPGGRIDHWVERTRAEFETWRASMPSAISAEVIFDQNHYTHERLSSLTLNLLGALAIVLLVLVVFMGVRSAITVGLALPLTIAMVLGGLHLLDIPLHQMSVTGLIIALGLLIDNAIVIVEDYKHRRARGVSIADAIARGVRHLAVPLAASTTTTVFAFLPVAATPGPAGEFTGAIAISVVLSVVSSFLLAMTVVPAITGYIEQRFPLPPTPSNNAAHPWWVNGWSNEALAATYRRTLDSVLRSPWKGVAIGMTLPLAGFALAGTLTMQFFPPVDRNQFHIQFAFPPSYSIQQTQRRVERAREILGEYDAITSDSFFLGEGGPRVYYNVMVQNDGIANTASAFVTTRSADATRALLPELQHRLMREFPDARVLAQPFEQGPPFAAPIELRITGENLEILRHLGEETRRVLATTPGVTYTSATLAGGEPKLMVHPDEYAALRAGLRMTDLPGQLDASLAGVPAGAVMEGVHEMPVRVRYADGERANAAALAGLPLTSANGLGGLPLEEIATLTLEPAASSVAHYQGQRINTVSGFLEPYVLPAGALADFRARLEGAGIQIPAGYEIAYGGEAEERSESVGNLLGTFTLFLVLMVAVVVLSLNSFRQAAIIGIVGGLSVGLALFGIRLFGWPLGFTALIGTLGLVGLAINGAIIVLSALKADPGACAADVGAIREVVVDSSRHIFSTTATTIGGFIPLIIFGGNFWPPLATAIAGGVAGSAILALYLVPSIFTMQASRAARTSRAAAAIADSTPGPSQPTALHPPERLPLAIASG